MGESADQLVEEEKIRLSAPRMKKTTMIAKKNLSTPAPKMKTRKRNYKCSSALSTVALWAIQCKECRKWRVIPTQEEYEEIRRKFTEDPFTCKRKENVSCDDSTDLEFGSKSLWVIDRPGLPKSPAGFKRELTVRQNFTRMDCYYVSPTGKKLRGSSEVISFLDEHPEYKNVTEADFSFRAPKIARESVPENIAAAWPEGKNNRWTELST